jgi:hypothetical protein
MIMKYISNILLLSFFCIELQGQTLDESRKGQVSFVSTMNVYVKFKSTAGISVGDTLFTYLNGKLIPVLTVNNLSSLSCVCTIIPPAKPSVADFVTIRMKFGRTAATQVPVVVAIATEAPVQEIADKTSPAPGELKQRIRGSVSVNSYPDMSDTPADNSHRFRYTLSLDAHNIGNSKFSFETYISFRHKLNEWDAVKSDIFNALKIFDFALIYDHGKSTRISIGRKINQRLSNIGAVDGVQIEKSFGNIGFGVLAGTRPDYTDYGFKSNLLQFGGYVGLNTRNSTSYSESSVAFMQQMNGTNIDRRFLYFQHSNSIVQNLYFIGTFEVDLYQLKIDTTSHTESAASGFEPTGMYLSLRYRFSDKLSVSGSYDARKNVIYYETYKTFTDRMLENEMRKGFRLQASYRFTRELSIGFQTGYRSIKSDPVLSRNVHSYLKYSNIPGLNVAVTLSGTYSESSYMNGLLYGVNVSRDFYKNKLQASIGYHYVDYKLPENSLKEIQHIGEINIFWMLPSKITFGINYEGTFEQQYKYNRIYLQLRKRF